VFDSLSDCGVVHGSLYSCLRAIFGLSVAGVLIAVFSCMLVYQLLSHERKKMYWEQLELRCRSLYASQAPPPALGPGREYTYESSVTEYKDMKGYAKFAPGISTDLPSVLLVCFLLIATQ